MIYAVILIIVRSVCEKILNKKEEEGLGEEETK